MRHVHRADDAGPPDREPPDPDGIDWLDTLLASHREQGRRLEELGEPDVDPTATLEMYREVQVMLDELRARKRAEVQAVWEAEAAAIQRQIDEGEIPL